MLIQTDTVETSSRRPPSISISAGATLARFFIWCLRWQRRRRRRAAGAGCSPIAPPYGERDSTIAPRLRFYAALFVTLNRKRSEKQASGLKERIMKNTTNQKTSLDITVGRSFGSSFGARWRLLYLYVRSCVDDVRRCKISEVPECNLGYNFMAFCAASLRGAYAKKAERKVITAHSQRVTYARTHPLRLIQPQRLIPTLEATLHCNRCGPPRCLRACVGANCCTC